MLRIGGKRKTNIGESEASQEMSGHFSLPRLPLGSLRSPISFSSSPNAEPGLRLQELEKHNNKETEKKMSYKQCIEAILHCLHTAIWSPVLHLFSSMLVSRFDSDVLFEWWNLAGAHNKGPFKG